MLVRMVGPFARVVGALVVLLLILAAFTSAPNALGRRLATGADVRPADAVVVLGASANADGTLTDSSQRRAVAGIRLYRAGVAPRLVLLGVWGEAEARTRLALDLGVPREAIVTEDEASTTRDEARLVARRLGPRPIVLVTDTLHMTRARGLFERAGFTVWPAPTDTGILSGGTPERRLSLTRVALQELGALAYHKLFGYL